MTTAVAAVRHFMACTGVAGGGLARPRPQGGGRIEPAEPGPPPAPLVRVNGKEGEEALQEVRRKRRR